VRYIAAYWEGWGETLAFRNAAASASEPFLFSIPRYIWRQLLVWGVLYRICRIVSPAPVWVRYLGAYSRNKGICRYWLRKRLEMRGKPEAETAAR
jgi:hypothetical protein